MRTFDLKLIDPYIKRCYSSIPAGGTRIQVSGGPVTFSPSFVIIGIPHCIPLGPYHAMAATVNNTGSTTLTGIVFGVFHNSLGQTLQISTGIASNVSGGENTTVFIISTLPTTVNYTVNFFVWGTSGSSLSASIAVLFNC